MATDVQGKATGWVERLTVAGATARGFVYLVVGCTALRASVYAAGKPSDFPGAFKTIAAAPMGGVLLVLVGAGLGGFALARVLEAILAMKTRVETPWMNHAAGLILALIYGALSFLALRVAVEPSLNQRGRTAAWAALLIAQPLGRWLLALVGIVVAAVGFHQLVATARVRHARIWKRLLACYGDGSHALLLVMLGAFALTAGIFRSPAEARGISGALSFLQHQIFGSVLLAVFGAGLAIYGVMAAITAFSDPSSATQENS